MSIPNRSSSIKMASKSFEKLTSREFVARYRWYLSFFDNIPGIKKHNVKLTGMPLDLVDTQKLIAEKMKKDDDDDLRLIFVENLRQLREMNESTFKDLTLVLLDACMTGEVRYDFLDEMTSAWIELAKVVSQQVRCSLFEDNLSKFQVIAASISKVGHFAIQEKLMLILICYAYKPELMLKLVDGLINPNHPIWSKIGKADELPICKQKDLLFRQVPNYLNQTQRNVVSVCFHTLWFNDRSVTPHPQSGEAWVDWNRGTKTVEFSFFGGKSIGTMDIHDSLLFCLFYGVAETQDRVNRVEFHLHEEMNLNCVQDGDQSTVIAITMEFTDGFPCEEFLSLANEFFKSKCRKKFVVLPVVSVVPKPRPVESIQSIPAVSTNEVDQAQIEPAQMGDQLFSSLETSPVDSQNSPPPPITSSQQDNIQTLSIENRQTPYAEISCPSDLKKRHREQSKNKGQPKRQKRQSTAINKTELSYRCRLCKKFMPLEVYMAHTCKLN